MNPALTYIREKCKPLFANHNFLFPRPNRLICSFICKRGFAWALSLRGEKRELWSSFRSSSHAYGVMTERIPVLSQVQATKMGFLRRVHGVTLRDMPSCEIRKSLNVEPLLLRIERSKLRWFAHVSRILQNSLRRRVLPTTSIRKRLRGHSTTRCTDYIFELAWSRLGVRHQNNEVAVNREVFRASSWCCPCDLPRGKVDMKMYEWITNCLRL